MALTRLLKVPKLVWLPLIQPVAFLRKPRAAMDLIIICLVPA